MTTLKQHQIERYFTYPQAPKMNAHCERFNRTIQESFSDFHEDLLFTDLPEFNRKLAHWLLFYNTRRPHVALNMKSPIQWLIQNQPNGQRLWTYTRASLFPLETLRLDMVAILPIARFLLKWVAPNIPRHRLHHRHTQTTTGNTPDGGGDI